ncbi:MAG: hypothetical protein EOL95_11960 [Bacteroidia bacterium]|nr:hypothetical protein [Bacteroidia bacterium]
MSKFLEFYTNPMDIVQFLDGEKAERLMKNVLSKAVMFHTDTGLSPIVKSEAYDIYLLDYYFLVHQLSEHVFTFFENQNIALAEEAKKQIVDDFGMSSKNNIKRLLINLLDYREVMFSNTDKRWVYSLKRYRGAYNGKLFLMSGVVVNGNFIKEKLSDAERERLEKISEPSQYVLEASGNKAMVFHQSESGTSPVLTFA